jgi:hypothetical protein
MIDPISIALMAVSVGSQIAKGISKRRAVRRMNNQANQLYDQGNQMVTDAMAKRTDYTVPQELFKSQLLAQNMYNDNSVQAALQAQANQSAGNLVSQFNRTAGTQSDAAAGALAAEQMRAQGMNQAAIAGAQNRKNSLSAIMSANQQIAAARETAYQYNVMTPFALNFQRGINLANQGLVGRLEGIKQRATAAGDTWGGIGALAGSIGAAQGTGTGFDLSGLFDKPMSSTLSQSTISNGSEFFDAGLPIT